MSATRRSTRHSERRIRRARFLGARAPPARAAHDGPRGGALRRRRARTPLRDVERELSRDPRRRLGAHARPHTMYRKWSGTKCRILNDATKEMKTIALSSLLPYTCTRAPEVAAAVAQSVRLNTYSTHSDPAVPRARKSASTSPPVARIDIRSAGACVRCVLGDG